MDLQGSKWRLGGFNAFELEAGETVELMLGKSAEGSRRLPVPHADFFEAMATSDGELVLNDAKSRLKIVACGAEWARATVVQGGVISAHKGITFRECTYRKEALNEKDRLILEQTGGRAGVRFAISYVRDAQEMQRYRAWLGEQVSLVAKLERRSALAEVVEIAAAAGEAWVCRGDMGAELGLAEMARAVSQITRQLPQIGMPMVMAGQVLEHMTEQPAATRSEVCYLHDCLAAGYTGFVLSDETAIGRYPVESCRAAALFLENGSPAPNPRLKAGEE